MSEEKNTLEELQTWFKANCDGYWEEAYGVTINSVDIPGWSAEIDLSDTWLEHHEFVPISEESADTWVECSVRDKVFRAFCGPSDLEKALNIFLKWARARKNSLEKPPDLPAIFETQLDKQSFWDRMNFEPQDEKCASESCEKRRITYSVMCRRHHYEQLHASPPPRPSLEIWIYGPSDELEGAQNAILAEVQKTYGSDSVRTEQDNVILAFEWRNEKIELQVCDTPKMERLRIAPFGEPGPNMELLMRLFSFDFVEPVRNRFNVVVENNYWTHAEGQS